MMREDFLNGREKRKIEAECNKDRKEEKREVCFEINKKDYIMREAIKDEYLAR